MTFSKIGIVATLLSLVFPLVSYAAVSDIRIAQDGAFSGKNLTVIQKSGGNLFMRALWGQAYIRVTLITTPSTVVVKNHGETASMNDIKEGDVLDVEGVLSSGADSILITPTRIRDIALQSATKTLTGAVKSVNRAASSFVLSGSSIGILTVSVSPSVVIKKGQRVIGFSDISAGDKILSVSGTYDYASNSLAATEVEVYQSKTVFAPRNFQGILKSVSGTTLPASLVVTVDGTDYTVYLTAQTAVLNNSKKPSGLTRFVAGDTVRAYGRIRPTNLTEVDAEVVRDTNF